MAITEPLTPEEEAAFERLRQSEGDLAKIAKLDARQAEMSAERDRLAEELATRDAELARHATVIRRAKQRPADVARATHEAFELLAKRAKRDAIRAKHLKHKRGWRWWHIFTSPFRWAWRQLKKAYYWAKARWRRLLDGVAIAGEIAVALSPLAPTGSAATTLRRVTRAGGAARAIGASLA